MRCLAGPGPAALRSLVAGALSVLSACTPTPFVAPPAAPDPPPSPDQVAAVVFLVGDAGDTPRERAPLLHRLRADVEAWSAAAPDSSVVVLFLGDNVYPVGVRDREDPGFPADSARLHGQLWAAGGPAARSHGTRVRLLPGNHDWGNTTGATGVARLTNQAGLVRALAGGWEGVALAPPPGDPGPATIEVGDALRLLLLDTHWWLQSADEEAEEEALGRLSQALFEGRGVPTVVAAHHPWATGGPHGGGVLDPFFLLRKTGSVVQDVNAAPYRAMLDGFSRAFRESNRPLVYAAGHDHSLQVVSTAGPGAPGWSVVSGAGSKLTPVGAAPGMEYAGAGPGYMRLVVTTDGAVTLWVEEAPAGAGACETPDPVCVERGAAAFRTTRSVRLR